MHSCTQGQGEVRALRSGAEDANARGRGGCHEANGSAILSDDYAIVLIVSVDHKEHNMLYDQGKVVNL